MIMAGETMMLMKNYALDTLHRTKAPMIMILVQAGLAGVNIFYKLASLDGMNLRILIAYRFLFAVAFISPLAFFLERNSRPKLTWTILGQAFLCGLFGGSLMQNLYLECLALTSATFTSAMANLAPAITFILAVSFRLEKFSIRSMSGRAKVLGTIIGISGAMVLTFYKGFVINLWPNNIHLYKTNRVRRVASSHPQDGNLILGALLSLGCSLSYATWLIIQTLHARDSLGMLLLLLLLALMSIMGAIQALVFALITDHDWEHWKLGFDIRLLTVVFTGLVGSGFCVAMQSWCVQLKGPLYVSIFSPLMLILVALASSLGLNEKLHMGSVLGAILIVIGLYAVLWGKAEELKRLNKLAPPEKCDGDQANGAIVSSKMTNGDHNEHEDMENEEIGIKRTPQNGNVTIEIECLHNKIVGEDTQEVRVN